LNEVITKHENPIESIDFDKIILDAGGKYPRKIIIRDEGGFRKEYRLVKTHSGNFILNK